VEAERPRHGNTSSATAANGKTSNKRSGKGWGKQRDGEWGRCRQVQVSELFSMEKCDKAVMDFLAATDIGKFTPNRVEELEPVVSF